MRVAGLFLFLLVVSMSSQATKLSVEVFDNKGIPVPNIVVSIDTDSTSDIEQDKDIAVMDQVDRQFKPHILVIQRGTEVTFPNSDSIKHHVYSFSPAKVFELQLYKGTQASPILFEKSGEVELGCNVHDWMLGYIYVVDTPFFAKTDTQGKADFDIPGGTVTINIWHPLLQEETGNVQHTLVLSENKKLRIQLENAMLESTDAYEENDEFGEYE